MWSLGCDSNPCSDLTHPLGSFIRYDWAKVATPVSDEDKALVTEMWCSETTVEGRPVLDGKVFK